MNLIEKTEEANDYQTPRYGWRRENLTPNEMPLLFLIPLIETAWAHGAIARNEKQLIFAAAREEHIDGKNCFNETIDKLLLYQPGRKFFDNSLSQIKSELAAMTVKKRELEIAKLIKRCQQVAEAAGGNSPMDIDNFTSDEEREVLSRLVSELNFRDDTPRQRLPVQRRGILNQTFANKGKI